MDLQRFIACKLVLPREVSTTTVKHSEKIDLKMLVGATNPYSTRVVLLFRSSAFLRKGFRG